MKRLLVACFVLIAAHSGWGTETEDTVALAETPIVDCAPGVTTGEVWTIERFQDEFCGEDCWEPFNRTMFGIFDWCMEYVVDPFCYIYSSIIPKPLIKGIDNFCEHVEYPKRLVSNLGCAEWLIAWDETRRFFINSTLGIGGLFDPSREWFYIFDSDATLADPFTYWGIPAGPRLSLPFMPRSSVRGHISYILDYAFDAKTWFDILVPSGIWFFGYSWALTPNKAPVWRGSWETLCYHTEDPYSAFMPLSAALNEFNLRQFAWHYYEDTFNRSYARMEAKQLPEGSPEQKELFEKAETLFNDVKPPIHEQSEKPANLKGRWRTIPGYAPRSPALDSMRALAFTPLGDDDFWWERRSIFCRDYSKSIDERAIEIAPGLPKAVYSFVAAPEPEEGETRSEKLVIIMPGIGTGRTGSETVAVSEMLHHAGYATIMVDSLFHWEFVRSANRGILPGNLTEDRRRLAEFLAKALDDLRADNLIVSPEISVIGWSMGGLSTVHLANMSDRGELPFGVHRFIAINPPFSMEHALKPFDDALERSRSWTRDEVYHMFVRAAPSLYGWAAQDHPRYDPENPPVDAIKDPWNYAPNLSDEQARYMLAVALNTVFPLLVEQRHKEHPFPWIKSELSWFSRRDFRKEIGPVLMREYITRYVPVCYDGVTPAEMIASADIRRLDSTLRGNHRVRFIHTWTDLLQTAEDREYFDDALGDRITWFDEGGHCGYFYTKPFQDELLSRLSE